jgi:ArsR family transcriptional regulator, arsenate/arsenite/antimonite-responsive transcriptional repressor
MRSSDVGLTHQLALMSPDQMSPAGVDASSRHAVAAAASPVALTAVLADPLRWRILTLLADAELCTTHLQELLDAKQTLVSHHLKVLREGGLVLTAPCGRFNYYRLRPGALDELAETVSALAVASRCDVAKRPC